MLEPVNLDAFYRGYCIVHYQSVHYSECPLSETPLYVSGYWYMCSACNYPRNYSYELTNAPAAQLAV